MSLAAVIATKIPACFWLTACAAVGRLTSTPDSRTNELVTMKKINMIKTMSSIEVRSICASSCFDVLRPSLMIGSLTLVLISFQVHDKFCSNVHGRRVPLMRPPCPPWSAVWPMKCRMPSTLDHYCLV
ncbi:Uncharacterised protein [Vibrio cholerae]|nr:Uncharacterised protein [Vibrio cholerae]